jgi:hypothetical protein
VGALAACGGGAGRPDAGPDAEPGPAVFGELSPAVESLLPQPALNPDWLDPGRTYFDLYSGRGLAALDVTGDGRQDIVVARSWFNSGPPLPVQVWVNQGDGSFAEQTDLAIADAPFVIDVATAMLVDDFNLDDRPDVVTIDSGFELMNDVAQFPGGHNRLLLSDDDGRLHDASDAFPVAYAGFNHVSSAGDVDDDGCLDIVVSELGGINVPYGGVYFLLGDCAGAFAKSITGLPVEIAERPSGDTLPGIEHQGAGTNVVADLDGDEVAELVTASYGPDAVSGAYTLRVFARSGDTWTEAGRLDAPAQVRDAVLPATFGAAGLQAGDLDGDGLAELIVLWEGLGTTFIEVLHNDGGLAFTDVTESVIGSYVSLLCFSGTEPPCDDRIPAAQYRLRDVDGDGDLDLVIGMSVVTPAHLSGRNFLYLNDGDGHLVPWRPTEGGEPASVDQIVNACAPREQWEIGGLPLIFDATGDGVADLVLVNTNHFHAEAPQTTEVVHIYMLAAGPI